MITKKSPCLVKFTGGPSDGLIVRDSHAVAHEKLRLPVTPVFVRWHSCRELVGYWSAVYLLTSRERVIDAGQPKASLHYTFLGYELVESQAERDSARQSYRFPSVRNWARNLRRKFVRWLLEPIDYPLKTAVEQPTPASRQAPL